MRALIFIFAAAIMRPVFAQDTPAPALSVSQLRAVGENYKSASTPRRLNGPVTVTADRAEWQQGGMMRYSGHVQLSVDTIELHGDNLELKQFEGGLYEAHMTGEPAHLNDTGRDGAPPVSADGHKIDYDARSAIVELNGGAVLTRGTDHLTGENIRYDVAARRVQAAGGNGAQVRIVIQPPPEKRGTAEKDRSADQEKESNPETPAP